MTETRDELRRRLEHYRRMLAEGVTGEMARLYLEEIAKATAALAEIDRRRE